MAADLDGIVAEFAQVLVVLDRAARMAAGAKAKADLVATDAAATGMAGVGQRMLAIGEQIGAMRRALTAAAGVGEQTLVALRAAAVWTSPGEVVEHLRVARERLDASREQMLTVARQSASVKAQVEVALRGAQPGPLLNRLDAVYQYLVAVVQHGDGVRQRIDEAIIGAQALGASAAGGAGGVPVAAPTANVAAPARQDSADGDSGPSSLAPYVPGLLEALPVRTARTDPTQGVLTTTGGVKIEDLHSGTRGPGRGAPKLVGRWRNEVVAVDHAEGHAAAIMRVRGILEATLYVNNRPCLYPRGCDRLLPALLPRGARLTVYGPNGFAKVYTGTGEGTSA